MSEQTQPSVKLIKKYKNRRLYDLDRSQYITIEELHSYVFQDIDFKVIDANTGKDLTNATLLQIFVELEANSAQILSPKILRQLIKLSQNPLSQQYKDMLEQLLSGFQEHMHPYLHGMQQTTELWTKQSEHLLKSWQDIFHHRS
ncbi:MAG: polyhydroxyalkanoate biosynthesis repressor PhaR [Legionella sp.]|nr:MAG: polyhydroxyalkanoate biosynthesis repressor PhaR [Legionella sp.]